MTIPLDLCRNRTSLSAAARRIVLPSFLVFIEVIFEASNLSLAQDSVLIEGQVMLRWNYTKRTSNG
jgi:hypothetical protein